MMMTLSALGQSGTSPNPDETAIRAIVDSEVAAWNRGDAKAFAARFEQDGSFTNIIGQTSFDHATFEQRHEHIFATVYKGSTMKQNIQRIKFITSDVALVDVEALVTGYQRLPPGVQAPDGILRTELQQLFVKRNGEWWIASFHNVDVKPLPPQGSSPSH
jgi:uncharacterized protein (TIGR02246 family)